MKHTTHTVTSCDTLSTWISGYLQVTYRLEGAARAIVGVTAEIHAGSVTHCPFIHVVFTGCCCCARALVSFDRDITNTTAEHRPSRVSQPPVNPRELSAENSRE